MELRGATVAVTGGGRGIGKAIARAAAREGAQVAVGDLDADLALQTARELGPPAVGLALDVTDRASFATFLGSVSDALGPLDALVNNAGIMHVGPFLEEDDAVARAQVEVNLHGVLLGMKLALPAMVSRGRGHVVNIASIAGKEGFPGGATYCATKHAVVGATDAVRAELAGSGVQVSAIMPSVVDTELAAGLRRSMIGVIPPEEVGRAVVRVLRTGSAEAYVPRAVGVLHALFAPLPVAWRSAAAARLGADRVLSGATLAQRAGYEARARGSAPSVGTAPDREAG